ncbi:hypothetical protein BSCG_03362 [Bacteroides sp. 2_2_4]|nr:hypothetical protein BSCG_03362 [Bacteroides sp. 2_2_4]
MLILSIKYQVLGISRNDGIKKVLSIKTPAISARN